MGDYNPQTPTVRGQEWLPRSSRAFRFDTPLKGLAQRFKATATTAPVNLHPYLSTVGSTPGLGLEIIEDGLLTPTVSTTLYRPGTDTGATVTGWEDQGNGAANYTDLNSPGIYLRNSAALAATGTLDLKFRGSTTALTSATRVTRVDLDAGIRFLNNAGSATSVTLRSILDIGGTAYVNPVAVTCPRDGAWKVINVGSYTLSPATDLPFVSTTVDDLWSGTDEFGVRLAGTVVAEGFIVYDLYLRVYTCTENRKGYAYTNGALTTIGTNDGWYENALSGTAALVSGSYYWAHLFALTGSAANYLETNVLADPDATITTNPTQTGEHRYAATTTIASQGGVITAKSTLPGEQYPLLIDNGAIVSQSTAFAELDTLELAEKVGGIYLDGTGDYISCPDSAGLSITSDLEVQVCVAMDDWTPSAQTTLISKWTTTGNQRSYKLDVDTSGNLVFYWSNDGTTENAAAASSATLGSIGATDGQGLWVGASIDVDNGAAGRDIKYYYSLDGTTWTQLGSTRTSATASSVYDSTAVVNLGAHTAGASANLAGTVYRARIIAGLVRTDIRAEPVLVATTGYPASLNAHRASLTIGDTFNNVWTLQANAAWQLFGVCQQITDAAGTSYGAIRLAVGWAGSLVPDGPLRVEVRSGAAAAEGRGTLLATAFVFPQDVPTAAGAWLEKDFAANFTSGGSTQYYVRFTSTAAQGRGWKLFIGDTRSDNISSGTTLAEIEGASQNGQTDSFVDQTAIVLDRYDSGCAFVVKPSGASSLACSMGTAA